MVEEFADGAQFASQLVLVCLVQRGELSYVCKYMQVLTIFKFSNISRGIAFFCRTSMMKNPFNTRTF